MEASHLFVHIHARFKLARNGKQCVQCLTVTNTAPLHKNHRHCHGGQTEGTRERPSLLNRIKGHNVPPRCKPIGAFSRGSAKAAADRKSTRLNSSHAS